MSLKDYNSIFNVISCLKKNMIYSDLIHDREIISERNAAFKRKKI